MPEMKRGAKKTAKLRPNQVRKLRYEADRAHSDSAYNAYDGPDIADQRRSTVQYNFWCYIVQLYCTVNTAIWLAETLRNENIEMYLTVAKMYGAVMTDAI